MLSRHLKWVWYPERDLWQQKKIVKFNCHFMHTFQSTCLTFYFGLMPVPYPYHLMKTLWLTSQRASSTDQVHVTAIVRSEVLAKFQLSLEARLELKQAKQRKRQTHTLILQWEPSTSWNLAVNILVCCVRLYRLQCNESWALFTIFLYDQCNQKPICEKHGKYFSNPLLQC